MSSKAKFCTYRLLVLLVLITSVLFLPDAEPSWAQTPSPTPQSSWADIWQRIVRRRDQEKPRTSRGLICPVIPQLVEQRVIWRDRPIFVWKGEVKTISVSDFSASQLPMWTSDRLENNSFVMYAGKPLKPGTRYIWQGKTGLEFSQVIFQMLDQPAHDQVTAKLMQLEMKLQQHNATAEARVQQRVQFFLDQNLFLDAIQELYTVPQPSSDLKMLQQQIVQMSCPD